MSAEYHFTMEGMKAIVAWVGSLVNWGETRAQLKDAQVTAALNSLMEAALETRHYLALVRDSPSSHDGKTEANLAKLWAKAGIDMSYIDSDLAGRYLMKADYWSDPQGWTTAEKDERLIQLDEVLRLGREALLA